VPERNGKDEQIIFKKREVFHRVKEEKKNIVHNKRKKG
jgi:hypothetical protein